MWPKCSFPGFNEAAASKPRKTALKTTVRGNVKYLLQCGRGVEAAKDRSLYCAQARLLQLASMWPRRRSRGRLAGYHVG